MEVVLRYAFPFRCVDRFPCSPHVCFSWSEAKEESDTECEFEIDPKDFVSEESSAEESDYDGSDASVDWGSGSYDDVSDKVDDLGELERKAVKARVFALLRIRSGRRSPRRGESRTIRMMVDLRRKRGVLLQKMPRARGTGSGERCVALSVLVWHYIGYIFVL